MLECGCVGEARQLEKLQKNPLKALQKSKDAIEQLILKIVEQDEHIYKKQSRFSQLKA